jgi:hypothetical protein
LIYFFIVDWPRSFDTPFKEALEDIGASTKDGGKTKKVIIENNQKRIKMIVYRERGDGGIQGILMDFYIDEETGKVANEFLRIVEREDGEIELVKIE